MRRKAEAAGGAGFKLLGGQAGPLGRGRAQLPVAVQAETLVTSSGLGRRGPGGGEGLACRRPLFLGDQQALQTRARPSWRYLTSRSPDPLGTHSQRSSAALKSTMPPPASHLPALEGP